MAVETQEEFIEEFNEHKFQDYSRKGLDYEFIETDIQLEKIAEVLDELKDYTPKILRGRVNLHSNVLSAIKEFVDICKSIRDFDVTDRDPNQKSTQVKQEARQLYDRILVSGSKYSTFPALALENRFKNTDLSEINDIVGQINDLREKASEITRQIEDSSRSKFANDYSKIFLDEANNHSRVSLSRNKNVRMGLGYAEGYLSFGLVLIIGLLYLILSDYFIPEPSFLTDDLNTLQQMGIENVSFNQLLIPFYLKKVIILALLLFGMRFCFKQFTIHKHLHTVNKHRANILNSFDFLYTNLKESGDESRDQYLIEVAKSIFNLNDTGFVKNESKDSISFIDNFKFFKDQS